MFTDSGHDREPSLSEMLADPIVRVLMRRDDVTAGDIERLVAAVQERRARGKTAAAGAAGRHRRSDIGHGNLNPPVSRSLNGTL